MHMFHIQHIITFFLMPGSVSILFWNKKKSFPCVLTGNLFEHRYDTSLRKENAMWNFCRRTFKAILEIYFFFALVCRDIFFRTILVVLPPFFLRFGPQGSSLRRVFFFSFRFLALFSFLFSRFFCRISEKKTLGLLSSVLYFILWNTVCL